MALTHFSRPATSLTGRCAWRLWLPLLFALSKPGTAAALPVAAPAALSQVVAQVVMGILSYSRWPVPPAPIRLCVLGSTQYAEELLASDAPLPGQDVSTHRIEINADLPSGCDAVYIGALASADRERVLDRVTGRPIVSIIENDPDCAVGSMFCLNVRPPQVGFRVNLDSIARSGVRIHPSVLQLARPRPSP
jgi:hypothetical protein